MHGSFDPVEPTTQRASQSVHPFLQGSRLYNCDRPTDRPRNSVCNKAASIADAAMRSKRLSPVECNENTNPARAGFRPGTQWQARYGGPLRAGTACRLGREKK